LFNTSLVLPYCTTSTTRVIRNENYYILVNYMVCNGIVNAQKSYFSSLVCLYDFQTNKVEKNIYGQN